MNAQQEAIALWQYIDSRGAKPTCRRVAGMLRSWGLRFRDADLVEWLSQFRGVSAGNKNRSAGKHDDFRAVSRKQAGNKNRSAGQQPGNSWETASRANKVPLVKSYSESTDVLSSCLVDTYVSTRPAEVFNFAGTVATNEKTRTPRQAKLPLNADNQIAARAILDAAWGYLIDHVPDLALSSRQWRERNKAIALDLAAQKKTPDEIVEMLAVAHEHPEAQYYRGLVMLGKLVERWHVLAQIAAGASRPGHRREREYQVL